MGDLHPSEYAVIRSALAFAEDPARTEVAVRLTERVLDRRNGAGNPPTPLARLLVRLAAPSDTAPLLDPACGTGSVLIAATQPGRRLAGQTGDPDAALLTALRLTLAGVDASDMDVHGADALRHDVFSGDTAPAIATSLPPNDRDWAAEGVVDRHHWPFGVPSTRDSELAWAQLALAHLRPDGRAALLLPASTATRPSGRAVRRELLRRGSLLAVFSLPRGSLEATAAAPHIWVLRTPDTEQSAPPPVLMVEPTELVGADGPDWPNIEKVALTTWRAFLATSHTPDLPEEHSRSVPVKDLLDDRVDLSPRQVPVTTWTHTSAHKWSHCARTTDTFTPSSEALRAIGT